MIILLEIILDNGEMVDLECPIEASPREIVSELQNNNCIRVEFGKFGKYYGFGIKEEFSLVEKESGRVLNSQKSLEYLKVKNGEQLIVKRSYGVEDDIKEISKDKYDFDKLDSVKLKCLAINHVQLIEFCTEEKDFSFDVLELHESLENKAYTSQSLLKNNPPTKYLVRINEVSITGVRDDLSPVFGRNHQVEVRFGDDYPFEPPILKILSPIWHPNIKCIGTLYKGMVCTDVAVIEVSYNVTAMLYKLKRLLRYELYQAEDKHPFPEDVEVAKWVREYAEPRRIVEWGKGINASFIKLDADDLNKKSLKKLIAKGEAIQLVHTLLENNDFTAYHNELYLHLSNINQVNNNLRQGLIDGNEQLFHLRNLNSALLSIIDEVL
ncbi:MAG: ubiquitin-conjugating enzyme E2 [Bacteroidota bacterium]